MFDEIRQTLTQYFPPQAKRNTAPYFTLHTHRRGIDWTIRMITQTSLLAAVELSKVQASTDFRRELSRIDRPALIVHGNQDASVPIELTGQPAAALIRRGLEVYEGGPHELYFTQSGRTAISRFCLWKSLERISGSVTALLEEAT